MLKPPRLRRAEDTISIDENSRLEVKQAEAGRKLLPQSDPIPLGTTAPTLTKLSSKPTHPSLQSLKPSSSTSTPTPTSHLLQNPPITNIQTEIGIKPPPPLLPTTPRKLAEHHQPPTNITGGKQELSRSRTQPPIIGKLLTTIELPTPCKQSDGQEPDPVHHHQQHVTLHLLPQPSNRVEQGGKPLPPLPSTTSRKLAKQQQPPIKITGGRHDSSRISQVRKLLPTNEPPTPYNQSDSQEPDPLPQQPLTSPLSQPLPRLEHPQPAVRVHPSLTLTSLNCKSPSLTSKPNPSQITSYITNITRRPPSTATISSSPSNTLPVEVKREEEADPSSPSSQGAHARTKPETKEKIKNKKKFKPVKNQPNISEAFKRVIDKNKDSLPGPEAARRMWESMNMAVEKNEKSEKEENGLEKLKENTTRTRENNKQQTTTNKITTTKNKNLTTKQKFNNSETTGAKPKLNLKIQGEQISDLKTLKDFLAKKKMERAATSKGGDGASHMQRRVQNSQRDQPTIQGEAIQEPNQIKMGLESDAAKGNTVLNMTNIIGQNKPSGCD